MQYENTDCDNQSDGETQTGPMTHLGLLGSGECDWTGGSRVSKLLEDVIGKGTGVVGVWTNGR